MLRLFFALHHQLFDFARLVGMRDRLRCPMCKTVGRWKPHGGWLDFADQRRVRRWLCKWCGWYVDKDGFDDAVMDLTNKVWTLKKDASGNYMTPKQLFKEHAEEHGLRVSGGD